MKIKVLLSALLLTASSFAQGPDHSDKLEKEKGYGVLQIGALYSKIKTVLQKDSVNRKMSFEPGAQTISYTDRIYLVDLKKPGYSMFCGKKIDRIEVWFMHHVDPEGELTNDLEISEVKIFFKATTAGDMDAFTKKMMEIYDNPASFGADPSGEVIGTWYSSLVLMNFASFYGDPVSEKTKKEYLKVSFESAVGG
jgi:hypothetical protein